MKWFWLAVVTTEAALVVAFCVWASSADYFVRMPASVRAGASVTSIVAARAAWLAVIFGTVNASAAAWISGWRDLDASDRRSPLLPLAGSVMLFLVACGLTAIFVVFGFPQY